MLPILIITRLTVNETSPCFDPIFIYFWFCFCGNICQYCTRTTSGQLISVGDSFAEMNTRIAQSPISMQTYEKKEGKTTVTVSNYTYEIDQINYTFTVIDNQIRKIEWIRKAP